MHINEAHAHGKGALRRAEAADWVGLPISSWDRLVKNGQAPKPIYLSPRRPVWTREVLLAWLHDLGIEQNASTASPPSKRALRDGRVGRTEA